MQADRAALGPDPSRCAGGLLAAMVIACAVVGCGGSGQTKKRAAGGGTPAVHISRRLKAREVAIHRRVLAALHQPDHGRYGGIPKDLRGHQAVPGNQILTSRVGRPADAIQGISVRVTLASGARALMTTVGPDVPDRDQGSFRNHTNATWAVTFASVHGRLPISNGTFAITDEQGQTFAPRMTVLGGGKVPAAVPRGRPFTLVLHARTSIGDGKVRYKPAGGRLLVEWDFDAETD
jgi:hypothetical protein